MTASMEHEDGLSSDDELSTLETAHLAKTDQDIQNQARSILSDVVEDFSTIVGVRDRLVSRVTSYPFMSYPCFLFA